VTVPDGAGVSGSGRDSSDESRELEHPATVKAINETATAPIFEKFMKPSVEARSASADPVHRNQICDVGEIATSHG
jgi:hypothetical protein